MDTPNTLPVLHAHPAIQHVFQFFAFDHLPPKLAAMSESFAAVAAELITRAPMSPETTVALRHLLIAKDSAVRAVLDHERELAAAEAIIEVPDDEPQPDDLGSRGLA